jgi:hypothetical protein
MEPVKKNARLEQKESYNDYDAAMALALSSNNADVMQAIETSYVLPVSREL